MKKVITYSFGENFIANLAEYILTNFAKNTRDLSRLAVVFGGKRPQLFLKRELANKLGMSFYPPEIFSIDSFIKYLVNKKKNVAPLRDLDAYYRIYNLVKAKAPQILGDRKSFSRFLPWAREIALFFEQMDLEDINSEALREIQMSAELGYEVPQSINVLLQNIIILRRDYHRILEEDKLYSRGLFYLSAARIIQELEFPEFERVLFCNFFDLYETEKRIIRQIYKRDKALLFFQTDERHWTQLNELAAYFDCQIKPAKHIKSAPKLNLYAGFDAHSQIGIVREIIKKTEDHQNTVIVLPNSDNLIALLSEVSAHLKELNVSVGYPVKRSALYSLFNCIIKAQNTQKGNAYYAKDYLKVLSHPLIKNLKIAPDPSVTRVLVHKIEEVLSGLLDTPLGGRIFVKLKSIEDLEDLYRFVWDNLAKLDVQITEQELRKVLRILHRYAFGIWEKVHSFNDFALVLEEFLGVLVNMSFLDIYPLNLKVVEKLFAFCEELQNAGFEREEFSKADIFKIFDDKLQYEKISFSGTPLKGLQILGLLETRSLNFENVVIMDMNESVLPKLRIFEPLIPRQIMIGLGLNRLEREEAIQKYQFLRLIGAAKNVHLLYDDNPDKQRSRFIEEIIWEKEKQMQSLEVVSIPRASFRVEVLPKKGEIEKSRLTMDLLRNFTFSASSVNAYLNCPLAFYFHYVLGLSEKEDLLEALESKEIGKFIHRLLEDSFGIFVGEKPLITDSFRRKFLAEFEKRFKETFIRRRQADAFMLHHIMSYRMEKLLDAEAERSQHIKEIIGLEHDIQENIILSGKPVPFKCRVDRIDRLENKSILILDYKTGSTSAIPRGIKSLRAIRNQLNRESIKRAVQSFQLPVYLYFLKEKYNAPQTNAALYNLRTLELDSFLKPREAEQAEEVMQICIEALAFIVGEIKNPQVPFKAEQERGRQCNYCPFFYLCR